jgi:hypothetical protein
MILIVLATTQSRTFCRLVCCQKTSKLGIYKTITLLVVLYVCETWSLALREEHGLRVFDTRVLRRIFGPKRDEVMGGGNCITRSFVICTLRQA